MEQTNTIRSCLEVWTQNNGKECVSVYCKRRLLACSKGMHGSCIHVSTLITYLGLTIIEPLLIGAFKNVGMTKTIQMKPLAGFDKWLRQASSGLVQI